MINLHTTHAWRRLAPGLLAGVAASTMSLLAPSAAFAQDDDEEVGSGPQRDEPVILVTGTRLNNDGLTAPTPVTVVGTKELLAARPQSIDQGLAQLPALTGSTTTKNITGSTKRGPGSFLNLRNLGGTGDGLVPRTLVLLDGRRVVPTNNTGNIDVNLLPEGLIQNVNIVTGGASAAYGSDAVAGVVDFRLDTRFEGLKIDAGGGINEIGDGGYYKFSSAMGTSLLDGRLHLVGAFDYLRAYEAFADNRDWARAHCAEIPVPGVTAVNKTAANPLKQVHCGVTCSNSSYGGAIFSGPLTTATQGITFDGNGQPIPFVYGDLKGPIYQVGGTGAWVSDNVNFKPPLRKWSAFGRAEYEISDNIQIFGQVLFAKSWSHYPQNSAFFYNPRPFTIFSGNPFIPASIQERMDDLGLDSFQLGSVLKDSGLIKVESRYKSIDVVAGLKGSFGGSWNWEVYYEHGKTEFRSQMDNFDVAKIYRAADAVVGPNGQIVCRASLTHPQTAQGCVPINLFGPGTPSREALNYVRGYLIYDNDNIQDSAAATISGEPFELWAGPVSFAAGVEWRKNSAQAYTDDVSANTIDYTGIRGFPTAMQAQAGGWLTFNPKAEGGEVSVKEAFAELQVPLLRDVAFFRELDFNGAVRVTDYTTSGTVTTWKVGLMWRPVSDLLIRATQSRDIRAPSLTELYASPSQGPNTVTDPFRNQESINILSLTTGNADLKAERAKTFTIGATYDSSWLPGFGLSVDYYDIKISDAMGTLGAQDTINRCFAGATTLCEYLTRDSTGALATVLLPTLNLSEARTRGIDFEVSYRRPLPSLDGRMSLRLIGTRLFEQSTSTPTLTGVNYQDRVGDIGLGYPKWRVNAIGTFDFGAVGFDLTGRYVGPGKINTTYTSSDIDNNEVESNFVVDLGARYTLRSIPGEPQLYFIVSNVFDKDPPLVPGTLIFHPQTNPALYDTQGRAYSAGVRMRF